MPSTLTHLEQERREARAPDGRRIVFYAAGPERGDLVVYHTGTPGIAPLFAPMVRECVARGLRLACAARPGYEGSDRLPGRSYADNPADTAVVADELGAESFYVLGHSGGGGPALADAALLGDRVRAVSISATLAPRPEMGPSWREGLDGANKKELDAIEAGEAALRELLEDWAEDMREKKTGPEVAEDAESSRLYSPVDRACFEGEYLDFVVKARLETASHGIDGWIDDDFAFFGDWGFDLAKVAAPVTIWQGGEDRIIPRAHAEWLAANVPGAHLNFLPEEGHISLLNEHFGEMLDGLIELG